MKIKDLHPNIPLKVSILEAGLTQRALSDQVRIAESVLSMAVRGRYILDPHQRQRIRQVLMKCGASDPFPDIAQSDDKPASAKEIQNGSISRS